MNKEAIQIDYVESLLIKEIDMNHYFQIQDTIFDITEKYPETIDALVAIGFDQFSNESLRKTMGKNISLALAAQSKQMNINTLEQTLIDTIEASKIADDQAHQQANEGLDDTIRIEGVLPCPIRIPLMDGFGAWLEDQNEIDPEKLSYDLKAASMGLDWIKETIQNDQSIDAKALPDLFMSAGFDLFFDRSLMGKYQENNVFQDCSGFSQLNENFDNAQIDLKDPRKQYAIIGVVPAIFMVNTDLLGDRPFPTSWKDLLDPAFENTIALPMRDLDLFNAVLLHIQKAYGMEGVEQLGRGLLRSMHPAQMMKAKTSNQEETPVVTIMPYFFTKMADANGPLKPVWPSDGAIISPIFLVAKKESQQKIQPLVDFFFSKEVGEIFSNQGWFPSTNPQVDNHLNEDQKFLWLGWSYIHEHDISELIQKAENVFFDASGFDAKGKERVQ